MNINLSAIPAKLGSLLRRFHVVLFVIVIFGGLAVAVFMLSSTLQASTAAPDAGSDKAGGLSTSFDTDTIERISELRTRQDNPNQINLPSGRINPFSE